MNMCAFPYELWHLILRLDSPFVWLPENKIIARFKLVAKSCNAVVMLYTNSPSLKRRLTGTNPLRLSDYIWCISLCCLTSTGRQSHILEAYTRYYGHPASPVKISKDFFDNSCDNPITAQHYTKMPDHTRIPGLRTEDCLIQAVNDFATSHAIAYFALPEHFHSSRYVLFDDYHKTFTESNDWKTGVQIRCSDKAPLQEFFICIKLAAAKKMPDDTWYQIQFESLTSYPLSRLFFFFKTKPAQSPEKQIVTCKLLSPRKDKALSIV